MRRNQSQNSNLRSTKAALPAYQRITSMANIKNIALPEFLRDENPFTLRILESPQSSQICTPLKPKILQKYSKEFKEQTTWKNFEDFYDFLIDANAHKLAVKIHSQEIKVQELLSIKNPKALSTPVIELSLSVIKRKNREITKKSDENPRILLSKVAFAEKLFKGQTVCTKINVLKYEFILFPVLCVYGGQRKSWSLVVIDNKEMCVYHYNYLNLNNSGDLFDCVRRFIAYQLGAEGKEIEKTAYRELKFLEIKGDNKLLYKDSGVYMLRKALHLAIGKAEEMQPSLINTYRTELLHLLYEFGAS